MFYNSKLKNMEKHFAIIMSNKYNVLLSAAILVGTVCYLWIKIRRNSKGTKKTNNADLENVAVEKDEQIDSLNDDLPLVESSGDDLVHSTDDCVNISMDLQNNDASLYTSLQRCDDIITDNSDMTIESNMKHLSVDSSEIIIDQSFTSDLCAKFKGMNLQSPQLNNNKSVILSNVTEECNNIEKAESEHSEVEVEEVIVEIKDHLAQESHSEWLHEAPVHIDNQFDEQQSEELSDLKEFISFEIQKLADNLKGQEDVSDVEGDAITNDSSEDNKEDFKVVDVEDRIEASNEDSQLEEGEICDETCDEYDGEEKTEEDEEVCEIQDSEEKVEHNTSVVDSLMDESKEVESELEEGQIINDTFEDVEDDSNEKVPDTDIEVLIEEENLKVDDDDVDSQLEEGEICDKTFDENAVERSQGILIEDGEVNEVHEEENTTKVDIEVLIEEEKHKVDDDDEESKLEDGEICDKTFDDGERSQGILIEDGKVNEVHEKEAVELDNQDINLINQFEIKEKDSQSEEEEIADNNNVEEVVEVFHEELNVDEDLTVEMIALDDATEAITKVENNEGIVSASVSEEFIIDENKTVENDEEIKVEADENANVTLDVKEEPKDERDIDESFLECSKQPTEIDVQVIEQESFDEKESEGEEDAANLTEGQSVLIVEETDCDFEEVIIEGYETETPASSPEMKAEEIGTEEENSPDEKEELIDDKEDKIDSKDSPQSPDLSVEEDSLDNLMTDQSLMNYIDEYLNESESERTTMTLKDDRSDVSIENWQNDEDSLNNIKRDFYELSETVCSPHPSSESDHAHCVNNLTERVATHSAESILDNLLIINPMRVDSNDDYCPELYAEKIIFGGKELDVVYFDESVLEECGVLSDVRIVRTIPVGISGRIIGKKGKTKNELLKKYGAELLIYNHPSEHCKQVLQITCNPSLQADLEKWADRTLEQILKNTIQTTVSNPEWLKPMVPVGKMIQVQIIDMPTIQHIKLRIYDPKMIKAYNKMQAEINSDYANADSNALLPSPVAVGCICIAMIRPDYFLRAEIICIYEQCAVVYLYDIGKTYQTCLFYLFKIREKYMKLPFQVIPARMPHAVIKNKKFTSAMVYRRFLCDQKTLRPHLVRAFIPRMNTCCEPCVHLYVPRAAVDGTSTPGDDDCVDLLELLVSVDVCSMVRETVDCDLQSKMNDNHFRHFLSEKEKKQSLATPVYFEPCNSKFYEDFLDFQNNENK